MQEIIERSFSAQMLVIHGEETSSHHIKQTEESQETKMTKIGV